MKIDAKLSLHDREDLIQRRPIDYFILSGELEGDFRQIAVMIPADLLFFPFKR